MKKNFVLASVVSVITFIGIVGFTQIKAEEASAPPAVEANVEEVIAESAEQPEPKSSETTPDVTPMEITQKPETASPDAEKLETKEATEEITPENQNADTDTDSEKKPDEAGLEKKPESDAEAAPKPLVIDGLVLTDSERKVFELTNVERRKRGLPALRLDRRLMESARRQANWMARTGVFQHGRSGFAENIAMGQPSSFAVVMAWMNSSGHYRNMMSGGHGAIGIGSYRGRGGAIYWCQQFSR